MMCVAASIFFNVSFFIYIFSLDMWTNEFGAARIDLDDCLTPAEYQWILIAVLSPVGSVAVIVISAYLVNNWLKKSEQNKIRRFNQLRNQEKQRNSSNKSGRGRRSWTSRSFAQFEIVEEE